MKAAALAIMALAGLAQAQGFVDEPTCYAWNGGAKSSGAFSKCSRGWVAAPKPAPVAQLPTPTIAPSPILAPQVSCAPPPKPVVHRRKPVPRKC